MAEIKLQHILTMIELLMAGAHRNFVEITTTSLAKSIGRSQQAASKHLLELESSGHIERTLKGQKLAVKITEKGYTEIQGLYLSLKAAIESSEAIHFEGNVVQGMGEGAYYLSLEGYRRQFLEKLGYEPYPGTLNVKLSDKVFINSKRELVNYPAILIKGFNDGKRTFGWVKCYPATINDSKVARAAVLALERTHYDDSILEVIAPVSIKESAGIKNGDRVKIKVQIANYT
jgi:riboflavin kinase